MRSEEVLNPRRADKSGVALRLPLQSKVKGSPQIRIRMHTDGHGLLMANPTVGSSSKVHTVVSQLISSESRSYP
jgi:hypothetical protein